MLQVTASAIEQIREQLEELEEESPNPFIRLYMSLGWGGPRLQLALEESANSNDAVTEVDGINFLVDSNQSSYFDNVKLDYTKNLFGLGEFHILNM